MSGILTDAVNTIKAHEKIQKIVKSNHPTWPESYKTCVEYLHSVNLDTSNFIQHRVITDVWIALFYKTWMNYRKTYIVDTDFFNSLTRTKSIRIYPSVLKTLPFNTFAIDLSGSDIFNGYILCSFDVTEKGTYCSFMSNDYNISDATTNKAFGVFLDAKEMEYDEKNEPYFTLDKQTEENLDIDFFRKPKLIDSISNIFKTKIYNQHKDNSIIGDWIKNTDDKHLEIMEEDYFDNLKNINSDTKWLLLKKALIQFAYYLCTPKPDVYETNETKRNIKRSTKLKKHMGDFEYKYKIGTRIGARIRLGRTISNDIGEPVEYTKGTTKCPHVRAAHWTHVWCGEKNNLHIEPRFIEVTFVNYTLGNVDEVCNEVSDKVKQNWAGENMVCRTLDSLNIKYKRQYAVVIDNHRYKFDVGIKINNKQYFIEYDGEQHFGPVSIYGGQAGFKRTRNADIIKNRYCFDNNIPLLRIPYKHKSHIDQLVKDFINNPILYSFSKNVEVDYYENQKFIK